MTVTHQWPAIDRLIQPRGIGNDLCACDRRREVGSRNRQQAKTCKRNAQGARLLRLHWLGRVVVRYGAPALIDEDAFEALTGADHDFPQASPK